jgi:hypothetical protein
MKTVDPGGRLRKDRHCEHGSDSLFTEIGLSDVALVGGKGANLGELTAAGLPVPPGPRMHISTPSPNRVRVTTSLDCSAS